MEEYTLKAKSFVPGHITGFFEIHLSDKDPMKCGSRGAGFCIKMGVTTTVKLNEGEGQKVNIKFNGEQAENAITTIRVVELMLGSKPYDVNIDMEFDLPLSQGLGMSGAGALGTAIAIDKALDLKLPQDQLVGYAHRAEVEGRTGLGDVMAQSRGGLEMRTRPGAPPFGEISVQKWDAEVLLVIIEPPLETSKIITSPERKKAINDLGGRLLEKYEAEQNPENFLKLSREFTEQTNLASEQLLEALSKVPVEYGAGMAMLGNTLFVVGEGAHDLAPDFESMGQCIQTEVENIGAF